MALRLENKVALVTGGGSGIGEVCCLRFAEEGAQVVVTDIDEKSANTVVRVIEEKGGKAVAALLDASSETSWQECLRVVVEQFGQLDVLVNNAGIALIASVEETTLEDWRKTQAINLDGVFLGTKEAILIMKKSGGSIINVSSIEGIIGEPKAAAYNASKGGVRIFTKSAALHCAQADYSIRVNSLHPGYVVTPMVAGALEQMDSAAAEEFSTRVMASIPLKRMAEPIEVANAALFLASDESSYVTGSELLVDGGYTAR